MNVIKSVWVWLSSIVFITLAFPVALLLWLISLLFDDRRLMNNRWMVIQGIVLTKMSPFWKVITEGREKIDQDQAYVIVPNHQSLLDIAFSTCSAIVSGGSPRRRSSGCPLSGGR
jgi:1-acyl-sn-glycerol-3-phosphate acyltransferase